MIFEKWQDILGNIKDKFEVENEGKEHIDEEGGIDIEYIVFKCPFGRMRLEYIGRPVILDKKTTFSRRIGSETQINYIYSEDEKSFKFIAYKWSDDENEWIEINPEIFDK